MTPTEFSSLGIEAEITQQFTGSKIEIAYLIDHKIIIHHYHIGPSKFPDKGNGKRLDMQITFNEIKYLLRTSSVILQGMIEKIPEDAFPVTTIIKRENKGFKFT